jgi:glycosyltransferase involved in cell wall biosynthesis
MKRRENLLIAPSSRLQIAEKGITQLFPDRTFTSTSSEAFIAKIRAKSLNVLSLFRHYEHTAYFADNLDQPAATAWQAIVWWLGQQGFLFDSSGRRVIASFGAVAQNALRALFETACLPYVFARVIRDLETIRAGRQPPFSDPLSVAYLRTDYWFGNKVGGSVGHVAGVANAFHEIGVPVSFLSGDRVELIDESRIPIQRVAPPGWMRILPEVPSIAYNWNFISAGNRSFTHCLPALIYQRASLFNYSGAYLAAKWNIPLVLEYNGSEIWVAENWGVPLQHSRWATRIETAVLEAAYAIVVISEPLKRELVSRGIDAGKILVNPNGVDPCRFNPDRLQEQRAQIRSRFGINPDKIVVGFIGTFGPWHGSSVLARSIGPVVERSPRAHFLMIGDGKMLPETRSIIEAAGVSSHVTFTGLVPQVDGPAYLAACDILVSPHVPNSDGSEFFGSPTKLFEYMAMGSGIVASRLAQIAEVLEHRKTALLVQPGSPAELASAICLLVSDSNLRSELGRNARRRAETHHTWRRHTERIIDHVRSLAKHD